MNWHAIRFGVLLSVVALVGVIGAAFGQYNGGSAVLMRTPLSGAAFVPPEQQAGEIAELRKEIAAMRQELQKLIKMVEDAAGPPDNGAATLRTPPEALITALGTCTQCHAKGVANKKGDSFVLFDAEKDDDGKDISVFRGDFQSRDLRRIIREVERDAMPKTGKLTADQKAALLAEVRSALTRLPGGGG